MKIHQITSTAIALAISGNAAAQVASDGTLGTNVSQAGSTYTISGGTIVNSENQFHSFSQFDLANLVVADFTGPVGIQNILSRITGGQVSNIDGTIRSSINGANLWIINPNGVVFGASSSLDVTGSFHVSSADYLLLEGGGQFFADPVANSVLTVGNPSTFGFLQEPTGNIFLNGANLVVPDGETMSFVAHTVTLGNTGSLTAAGGRLNLVSVGSVGEVTLLADGIDNSGITYNGDGEAVLMTGKSTLDVSGNGGGSIYIRGGQFRMGTDEADDETIRADTLGSSDGGVVDIAVAGGVRLQGVLTANTFGSGAGGNIQIDGDSIGMAVRNSGINGEARIEARAESSGNAGSISLNASQVNLNGEVLAETTGSGSAGNISVTSDNINIFSQGSISSRTSGFGVGGDISVVAQGQVNIGAGFITATTAGDANAGNILISGNTIINPSADSFTLTTSTSGAGSGGDIRIEAATSISLGAAMIQASTSSIGQGGSIAFDAPVIDIFRNPANQGVSIEARTAGSGAAGRISFIGDLITIEDETRIIASTDASGDAGDISISAANLFDLDGPASIQSRSSGTNSGSAGTISITAGDVSIENGTSISVSTESNGVSNRAGQIDITGVQSITINNNDLGNPVLSATTTGDSAGGSISIASPVVRIDNSLMRSSTTGSGDAGSIGIAGNVSLDIFSSIFEAGTRGLGRGGNIILSGGDITLDGFTDLLANTFGTAQAGNIEVNAENVQVLAAFIEATAGLNGIGGNVEFNVSDQLHIADTAIITATTQGVGVGGNVTLNATSLRITANADISVSTTSTGAGGTVTINAVDALVDGQAIISGATSGDGTGGSIQVFADDLRISGDGQMLASTSGDGAGGIVGIDATSVVLEGNGSISGNTIGAGTGGTVDITADDLLVHEGGSISADTNGSGTGGNILINAVEMAVSGQGLVSAATSGAGMGGNIDISGGFLTLSDGGRIEASTVGTGVGGSIGITSDNLVMDSNGRIVVSASGVGDAGAISVDTTESIFMDDARMESTSVLSNGGDVEVSAGDLIFMTNSEITTSANAISGSAGNIRLGTDSDPTAPAFLIIQGNAIRANAGATGGAINVHAQYILGTDNVFEAISDTGNDGEIVFDVPATDFVSVISQLDLPILNVAELLDDQCVVSALSERSSFVIDTVGLPPSPEAYKSSGYYLPGDSSTTSLPALPNSYVASVLSQGGC